MMCRRRVAAAILASLFLGLASSTAAAASAEGRRTLVIHDCVHARYQPKYVILACGDGNFWLKKMHYRYWHHREAWGHAVAVYNTCHPDCARGHDAHFKATFKLFHVDRRHGEWLYGKAAVYRDGRRYTTYPLVPRSWRRCAQHRQRTKV